MVDVSRRMLYWNLLSLRKSQVAWVILNFNYSTSKLKTVNNNCLQWQLLELSNLRRDNNLLFLFADLHDETETFVDGQWSPTDHVKLLRQWVKDFIKEIEFNCELPCSLNNWWLIQLAMAGVSRMPSHHQLTFNTIRLLIEAHYRQHYKTLLF